MTAQNTSVSDLLALAGRLEKRAEQERAIAENNAVVAALLQPQRDMFNAREGAWNTYAVRMQIDHQRSSEKDAAFASDLEVAAAALRARLNAGEGA